MLTIAHESALPNPRRGWATLASFALQATALTAALLVRILLPGMLPRLDLTPRLVPLFLSSPLMPSAPHSSSNRSPAMPHASIVTVPPSIPFHVSNGPDTTTPQEVETSCSQCVPGVGLGNAIIPGGMNVIGLPVPPAPAKPVVKPPRVSVMMDGLLVHRVQPVYPILAQQTRVQGPVQIAAVISKEGAIENLRVVSGHPMLIHAALDAVKQWRYRPYVLNGDPIEVETEITVIFSLGGH